MTKELSETRKADRAKMATILVAVICDAGGVGDSGPCSYEPSRTDVHVRGPGGARVTVDFSPTSCQPNVFVLSWNIDSDSDDRFAPAFGSINPYHFAKATDVAHGFDNLCDIVRRRVGQMVDGIAYSEERKAAMIAKNGYTAAERRAQWAEFTKAEEVGAATHC